MIAKHAISSTFAALSLACTAARTDARTPAPLPPLVLVDTAGARTSLPEDLAHTKLTVVVFYADHCPCFHVHEDRLRQVNAHYGPLGVRLLVVDSEVSADRARDAKAAGDRALPPILLDPGAKLADALAAEYATYTVVLDAEGRVRYRGGIDSDKNNLHADARSYLSDALDDLLAGRELRVAEGKTLGCALQKR